MPPAHREPREGDPSTRDALMDAAVDQLMSKGVLAGLNLREVADAVGVTPANIYHYFGSRQGLLRAAIARETARLAGPLAVASDLDVAQRRLHMFDAITANPRLALTALLALDGDPDYQPFPFLAGTREYYARAVADGQLPDDVDAEAVHLLGLAVAIGVAIYADAAASQLGTTADEVRSRTRAVFERMLDGVTNPR